MQKCQQHNAQREVMKKKTKTKNKKLHSVNSS